MMTSSNGNIFRVTGPLCGEFTGLGEVPTQRPVKRSFDVFFDLRLNKRLSKQPWSWWFATPSWSLWRQCDVKNITKDDSEQTEDVPMIQYVGKIGFADVSTFISGKGSDGDIFIMCIQKRFFVRYHIWVILWPGNWLNGSVISSHTV